MTEAALDPSQSRYGGISSILRQHWATIGLVLANLIVYVWMGASGVSWTEPDPEQLVEWGANLAPFTLSGDSWRLFSSMFVHGGAVHLLLNMYMLLLIGPLAQKRFGGIGFLAIYLATGLAAGLTSAWWHGTHPVTNLLMQSSIRLVASVGASGALMGLAGALCVAGLSDADMGGSRGKALAQVVLLNLGMGFMVSGVDQACHIGGLLTGLPLGALGWLNLRPLRRHVMFAALAGAAVAGAQPASRALGSDELSEMAVKIRQQRQEELEQARLEAEKAQRVELARSERAARPKPVSKEQAAGVEIPLSLSGVYGSAVLSADGARLYLADTEQNSLEVVDLRQQRLERSIAGPKLPVPKNAICGQNLCRGIGAWSVALSPDERWALVPGMANDAVALVDLRTGGIVHRFATGRLPSRALFSRDGQRAYVINAGDNTLSTLDLAQRRVIGQPVRLGEPSQEVGARFNRPLLRLNAAGDKLLLSDARLDTLQLLDLRSMQPSGKPLTLPSDALDDWAADPAGNLWWPTRGNVMWQYQGEPLAARQAWLHCEAEGWQKLAASADGAWLASYKDSGGVIRLLSRRSLSTVGVFPVDSIPRRLLFSRDGKTLLSVHEHGVTLFALDKSMDAAAYVAENEEAYCNVRTPQQMAAAKERLRQSGWPMLP